VRPRRFETAGFHAFNDRRFQLWFVNFDRHWAAGSVFMLAQNHRRKHRSPIHDDGAEEGYNVGVATKSNSGAKKPVAKRRVSGIDKGKIWMADDFDVLTERELAYLCGVAEARLEKGRPSLTSNQVRKALGLEP